VPAGTITNFRPAPPYAWVLHAHPATEGSYPSSVRQGRIGTHHGAPVRAHAVPVVDGKKPTLTFSRTADVKAENRQTRSW